MEIPLTKEEQEAESKLLQSQYDSLKLNSSTNSSNTAAEVTPLTSAAPTLKPPIKEKYIEKCNKDPIFVKNDIVAFDRNKIKVEPSGVGFYVLLGIILVLGLSFIGALYMGFLSVNIDQPLYNNNVININNTINSTTKNDFEIKPTTIVNNNYTIVNKIYVNGSS